MKRSAYPAQEDCATRDLSMYLQADFSRFTGRAVGRYDDPTRMTMKTLYPITLVGFVACGGASSLGTDEADATATVVELGIGDAEDVTLTFSVEAATEVRVDCSPPSGPDDIGPVVTVVAPELGFAEGAPPRAGFVSTLLDVTPGSYSMSIENVGDEPVSCKIYRKKITAGVCGETHIFHSPNTNATHITVGSAATDWEAFPVSGNHWGAWVAFNQAYPAPVKTGFLLHALEHGAIALSYKCSSPTESDACAEAQQALINLAGTFGEQRVFLTPDPSQPEMFAIRAWRWGYSSECLDETSGLKFMNEHFRNGREDIDADPPIPFDPTTLDVPCEDLMGAPDSC